MFETFGKLLGLIRFSHTIFALPFALISAILAWQREPFRVLDLVGILSCMVFARSFAMAFNRVVDRRIDAGNPRTAGRHLPARTLSLSTVVTFMLVCAVGFVASTFLFWLREVPNLWPSILSVPVLGFLAVYSLTKRFTTLAHVWLGASLMLAPISAWIAIVGMSHLGVPALIGLAVLMWVTGFDIIYACQDAEFDRQAGLFSIPAAIGIRGALRIAFLAHVGMLGVLVALGLVEADFGVVYWIGLGVIAAILFTQHWLVRPDDLSRVNAAFFQVNAVVSMGLLALVIVEVSW